MSFPPSSGRPVVALLFGGLLASWLWPSLHAFDSLTLQIEQLQGEGWQAQGLSIDLDWQTAQESRYRLLIDQLELPDLQQSLKELKIDCTAGEWSERQISCRQGRLQLPLQQLDSPGIGLSFSLDQLTGGLKGRLQGVAVAGGRVDVAFEWHAEGWQADITGRKLSLQTLARLLPQEQRPLPGWSYQAALNPQVRLRGQGTRLLSASWEMAVAGLSFADDAAESMGEGLGGRLNGRLEPAAKGWRVEARLEADQGELLTPYFYHSPAKHPLSLTTAVHSDSNLQRLSIAPSRLNLRGLLELAFETQLDLGAEQPLQRLSLELAPAPAELLYRELLQPVLFGTPWERLELEGLLSLRLQTQGQTSNLDLVLKDFHFDDAETADNPRRLGLYGINSEVHWRQDGTAVDSWIEWQNGHLLERIDLGGGRLDFSLMDRDFRLTRAAQIPILDGSLQVDRLQIQAMATQDQNLEFDGMLTPISMGALSEALGWLPLQGKLSGMIPGLSYRNGLFRLDGVLLVSMFDGDILIDKLKVRDLFGVYPQLGANIQLKGLDLETLTGAFSFGRITGRLDGYVRDLSLEDWRPVAFDAHFYTPENDASRRRISQKAVDNISNLGGAGMSGALARSFIGFFEEFNYRRIGIGCRLRSGQCEMKGAGEAEQGYYLVKGSGIPRIDIIGYNRTADWDRLVEQLKQITESGGPVIQ